MKKKKYANTKEKIKCNVNYGQKIPESTYSMSFKIDKDILLNKTEEYMSSFLNNDEKIQLKDFFNKKQDNIVPIIEEQINICISSLMPTEQEVSKLFESACKESLRYCYDNRDKRVKETRKMIQNEGIENYIERAKKNGLIDDNTIQKKFVTWNNMFDEETNIFYTYLDIYSEVEAIKKCYLYFLPQNYENAVANKIGKNMEDYIFSNIKENLKSEISKVFNKYREYSKNWDYLESNKN